MKELKDMTLKDLPNNTMTTLKQWAIAQIKWLMKRNGLKLPFKSAIIKRDKEGKVWYYEFATKDNKELRKKDSAIAICGYLIKRFNIKTSDLK